tara:strand:+ start:7129 stop:7635 length:507 start_codon:yes stop_codon:yes gene_type:complete
MNAKQNPELYYLVNPVYSKKICKKEENKPIPSNIPKKKEKLFYKKRIQQLTKDCMQNKAPNSIIESAYNEYIVSCINYFKQEDTNELIQQEYEDLIMDDTVNESESINIEQVNKDLYIKKKNTKIEDCFPITKTLLNEKKNITYPKQKEVDIKNSKFKVKGLKKKEKI